MIRHAFMLTGVLVAIAAAAPGCMLEAHLATTPEGGSDGLASDASDRLEPHDHEEPGDAANPDAGAESLHIEGHVDAMNEIFNAATPSAFETRFTLDLDRDDGSALIEATVTVTGSSGARVTLAPFGGTFVGMLPGYDPHYTIDVTADGLSLHGIVVSGPVFHQFTAPAQGQVIRSGSALLVQWTPSGAEAATIVTQQYPETAIPDTGSYMLPGSALVVEPGHLEPDRIRVRRRQHVAVPGALPGSTIDFEIRNEVGIQVDAQ